MKRAGADGIPSNRLRSYVRPVCRGGIFNDRWDRAHGWTRAGREEKTLLAQDPSHRVEARRPCRHPLIAEAMQGDQRLLSHTFDGHRGDLSRARRFEQATRSTGSARSAVR